MRHQDDRYALELTDSTSTFERIARQLIAGMRSVDSRRAYTTDLNRWLTFCRTFQLRPEEADIQAVLAVARQFRDQLTRSMQPNSARRVLAVLSSLYRKASQLATQGTLTVNPFHPGFLAWPVGSSAGKTAAVPEDVAEAMIVAAMQDADQLRGARDAALLRLLYDTGLRRASVAQLKRTDIEWRPGGGASILAVVKGQREVQVELPEETQRAIGHWLRVAPASTFLFPGKKGSMDRSMINKIIKARAEEVGAEAVGVHPHAFRTAFVTSALDAGMPLHEVQAAVHHASPEMTQRYDRGRRGDGVSKAVAEWRKRPK